MIFQTADLSDKYGDIVQVADSILKHYGGQHRFHGEIVTLRVPGDFLLVKDAVNQPGLSRVLVVDGGGVLNYALLGDRLAAAALANGWAGVIINGCIRDSDVIAALEIGVMALSTCPARPAMEGAGEIEVDVTFAGVDFVPGYYVYVDNDGMLVSSVPLNP